MRVIVQNATTNMSIFPAQTLHCGSRRHFYIVFQIVFEEKDAVTYTKQYLLSFCTTNAIKLLQDLNT